jgi:histidine ammonia-lyase
VAAIRALRQRDVQPAGPRLRALYDLCLDRLPADGTDRPLDIDIAAAEDVIAAVSR